jgi:hypothetical protein
MASMVKPSSATGHPPLRRRGCATFGVKRTDLFSSTTERRT